MQSVLRRLAVDAEWQGGSCQEWLHCTAQPSSSLRSVTGCLCQHSCGSAKSPPANKHFPTSSTHPPTLCPSAGQLHVTQNEGCKPAEVLAVFPVGAVDAYFFPYSEVG